MRFALLLCSVLGLVACGDDGSADAGCVLNSNCPRGEECVNGFCTLLPGDAAVESSTPSDSATSPDGVGLPDSAPTDSSGFPDAGADVPIRPDGGGACIPERPRVRSSDTPPNCSESTRACATACSDQACLSSCIEADTTPQMMGFSCTGCFNAALMDCYYRRGCEEQWNVYECCTQEAGCGSPHEAACTEACSTTLGELQSCGLLAGDCTADILRCF